MTAGWRAFFGFHPEFPQGSPLEWPKCDDQGFSDGLVGKNPPAMQETPVQFLSREDALEKG